MNLRFGALPYTLNFPNYLTKKLGNDFLPFVVDYDLRAGTAYAKYYLKFSAPSELIFAYAGETKTQTWTIQSASYAPEESYSSPNGPLFGFDPCSLQIISVAQTTGTSDIYFVGYISAGAVFPYGFSFFKLLTPVCFRTENSFNYTNDNKESLSIDIYNYLMQEQLNAIGVDLVSYSISSYGFSCSINNSLVMTPVSELLEFKLLNKADYSTCLSTPINTWDPTFFNSLTSPTLADAVANGGCQFFGIVKHQKPVASGSLSASVSIPTGFFSGSLPFQIGRSSGAETHSVLNDTVDGITYNYYGTKYTENYTSDPSPNPIAHAICLLP